MRDALVEWLADPRTGAPLRLTADWRDASGAVVEGRLASEGGTVYPITNAIPRLLARVDDGQRQTRDSFGFKWAQAHTYASEGVAERSRQWLAKRYGFASAGEMQGYIAARGRVLDAGCGSGFSTGLWLTPAWNGAWVGAEISPAIDLALSRLAEIPGTHFVQADIVQPPFRPSTFDVVVAEGVLHHTPLTERAFHAQVALLRPGGELMAYIYRRKGPVREFTDDYLRHVLSPLPPEAAWEQLRPLTALGQALAGLHADVDLPEGVPVLGIPAGRHDVQRLLYLALREAFLERRVLLRGERAREFRLVPSGLCASAHRRRAAPVVRGRPPRDRALRCAGERLHGTRRAALNMCGIAGAFNANGEPVALPLLQRMGACLAHRGPDGDGEFVDGPVGLAHRRLAIIDLTPRARQPMSNELGDVVLTYNGEIYNFEGLRAELEAKGHQFRSRTDSEVVIHAYEEWGPSCVERFNGMFAFAIWDATRRRLMLARDRFGIKPLYYYWDGRVLVFASEIKAILAHPSVSPRVCVAALNEYFTFQNLLSDATLFDGIRIVPPGAWAMLDAEIPALDLHTYWDFDLAHPLQISYEDATDELYRLFTQAVTRQLVSDVPIGAYLSGGMDSGSITAVARKPLGRLLTFTCGFDLSSASGLELGYDERANAEALANLLKTEHYEVVLHAGDMEHVMPDLIWHLEDLRVGQCYPNYYVARLAGKFVKVVLSGCGGDEMVAGYPWRYYRGSGDGGRDGFYRQYYDYWQRLVPDDDKVRLFTPQVWADVRGQSTFDAFRDVMDRADGVPRGSTREDYINASLYFELKTFLHGLLVVEDRVSMAHGLETRVPFLDHDLVDFVQRLPVAYKLRYSAESPRVIDENETAKRRRHEVLSGDGKLILREAMSRIIPPEVTERAKQGFSAPDASWFRGESIEYIKTLLGDRRARIFDYLQPSYVDPLLKEHADGVCNHRLFIWSLLSFEWWLRVFMP